MGEEHHAHRALHGSRRAGAGQPLLPRRPRGRLHLPLGQKSIDTCLRAAGGRPDQVVKVLIFMTDVTERVSINPIRQRYFGEHRPASTLVEVTALVDPRMKVEIEAVAYVGA